jgi:hypothetical protein
MTETTYNDGSFSPPPSGGGDWLTFTPCPYPPQAGIAPWFNQFAGASSSEVVEILRNDWRGIRHPATQEFARTLLHYQPFGILHSAHANWEEDTWLVLSRFPVYESMARAIANREELGGMRYLAAPYSGDIDAAGDLDEWVRDFFIRFGGMRLAPPFYAEFLYRFPQPPVSIEPFEVPRIESAEWRDSLAFFMSDTSDELVLNFEGKCGWLLAFTREVVFAGTFEDILKKLASAPYYLIPDRIA